MNTNRTNQASFSPTVAAIEADVVAWRRHLHQNPELSFVEFETTAYIEAELARMGVIAIQRPTKTGLVASLIGTKPGKTAVLAIRADIDALPIEEENELPYKSSSSGVMHACGHDGHTAILLAVASLLQAHPETFCGEARLIFQHAEELPPGGAIQLARAGALDGVDAVLGLHLSSNWETGIFGLRSGVLTAAVDRIDISIQGKGGHSAFPEQCLDPVVAMAQLVLALQTVVSRRVPASEPAVLSICTAAAGNSYNIIPDTAHVSAAVRSFSEETRSLIAREVKRIAEGVSLSTGTQIEVDYQLGYPSVVNDAKLTQKALESILARFGSQQIDMIGLLMPSEDFSYLLDGRPGFFVELGSSNVQKHSDQPHHSPHYRMDEDALLYGVQYFYDLVQALLDGNGILLG